MAQILDGITFDNNEVPASLPTGTIIVTVEIVLLVVILTAIGLVGVYWLRNQVKMTNPALIPDSSELYQLRESLKLLQGMRQILPHLVQSFQKLLPTRDRPSYQQYETLTHSDGLCLGSTPSTLPTRAVGRIRFCCRSDDARKVEANVTG